MSTEVFETIKEYFKFRSVRDNNPWNSPKGTRVTLAQVFGALKYERGAEIGVRAGAYSYEICRNNPHLKAHYCIDPWSRLSRRLDDARQDAYFSEAQKRLAAFDCVRFIKKFSRDAVNDIEDRSLDYLYIDGDHSWEGISEDLLLYVPKVKHGGIIGVHDYFDFFRAGVKQVVDSYTHCNRISPWFCTRAHRGELEPSAFWINP